MTNLFFLASVIPLLIMIAPLTTTNAQTTIDNNLFLKCYNKVNIASIVPLASMNDTRAALQLFKTKHIAPTDGLLLEEVTLVNICMTDHMVK